MAASSDALIIGLTSEIGGIFLTSAIGIILADY